MSLVRSKRFFLATAQIFGLKMVNFRYILPRLTYVEYLQRLQQRLKAYYLR